MSIWHPRRRTLLAPLLACAAVLAGVVALISQPGPTVPAVQAQSVALHCDAVPMGALPYARPVWCEDHIGSGPSTVVQGPNSWLDEWEHHLHFADIGAGYRTYQAGDLVKTQHFRHDAPGAGSHWMADLSGLSEDNVEGPSDWDVGGALLRPDRSFRFENGKLIIEAEVAAGIAEYGGEAWPELVVSTAPAPTGNVVDGLYAYGQFGGQWAVGCRLQASRSSICALYEPGGVRVFEISHFQHEGAQSVYGGEPGPPGSERDLAWNVCEGTDPDTTCRDLFRWELTRDTLTLYVNGVKYMEHAGLPAGKQLPDAMLNGEVYVYFADWIHKPGRTVRFHWDEISVQPQLLGTPGTSTPSPSSTATAAPPTATSSATPTPSPTTTTVPETPTPAASGTPTATVPAVVTATATAPPGNVCDTALIDGGVVVYRRPAGCVLPPE